MDRRYGQLRRAGRVRPGSCAPSPLPWPVATEPPNSDVLDVTGTAPVTFAEFAAKTAPAWK
jgi:hypothetical protein